VGGTINAGQAISTTQFGYTGQLTSNALAFTRNSFNYVYLSGGSSASLNFQATTTTANDTSVFSYNNTRVSILPTTASTGTTTGALVVSGGVGVAGDVYAGGTTGFKLGSSSGAYRFSAGAFIDAESSSVVRLLDSSANFATVKTGSLIALTPATAPSLTVNSTMTFELTSNTTLKVFVRGTDGTTRSVSLTLA
jgi:hypothetical protein